MLVRLPIAPARYLRDGVMSHVALAGGYAQVLADRVLVVTARCRSFPLTRPTAALDARQQCARWGIELADLDAALAGYA
jgi:hypothetical protein